MILRVVCDTMVFYQWATIRRDRPHGIHAAFVEDRIRLFMSAELITEVRDLLARPAIRAKSPNLTDERISRFIDAVLAKADFVPDPPKAFTIPQHSKDDHVFNLAIAAQAHRLVTWEDRLLKLESPNSPEGERLRTISPQLRLLTPAELMIELKVEE